MSSGKIIWHVISNRWNSAITEYALSSAKALEKRGYRSIFSAVLDSPAHQRAQKYQLETIPFDEFTIVAASNFVKNFKKIKPDSILLFGGPETALARFIGKQRAFRFFGHDLNKTLLKVPFLFSFSYSHISKFFVPNDKLKNQVQSICKKKIEKITLGLDINADIYPVQKNNQIVILGRLDPVKGHARFLKIFKNLLDVFPSHKPKPVLHIIGQDANLDANEILRLIKELNLKLGSDVLLSNSRVNDIYSILKSAELGVISSLGSEQICRVAEEFLLLGTPVLVSGAGATEEVLFPGAGSSYKTLNDEEASREALSLILKIREENEIQKFNRINKAQSIFSLERMGEDLENFIFS